ncbi:MAG TPA: phosphotransferase [Streptosporangiaceae bacterium]|jgi:homoserine kinase type II
MPNPSVLPTHTTPRQQSLPLTPRAAPLAAVPDRADDPGSNADTRLLGRVLRRWRIGAPRSARTLTSGLMNLNWRVETDDGTYALKRVSDIDRRTLRAQHEVIGALAEAGIPVPVPLRTRRGATHTVVDGDRYVLHPWVAGRHRGGLDLGHGECVALGERLAALHGTLARLMPPVQQSCYVPTPRAEDSLITIERLLEVARTRDDRDSFDDLVERRLLERGVLLSRLAGHRPPEAEALASGYVHGDFHSLNLLFDDAGDLAAILDWDRLAIGTYAGEVVRAGVLLFAYRDGHGLDLDRIAAFVAGYRATTGLEPDQLRSAAYRMWWDRANDFWMLDWRYQRDDIPCGHLFPAAASLVAWWTDNLAAVTDAFTTP